jgi:curved DNA-binding protein CbpA
MGPRSSIDYYAVLEVRPDASQAEVRAAYLRLSKQFHPDRVGLAASILRWRKANAQMARINAAYEVLGDERKRAGYDGARRRAPGGGHKPPTGPAVFRPPRLRRRRSLAPLAIGILIAVGIVSVLVAVGVEYFTRLGSHRPPREPVPAARRSGELDSPLPPAHPGMLAPPGAPAF